MQISAIPAKVDASRLPVESLANNQALTENQKIAEASRQFEAILLREFLAESQKPVFKSEFTDDSTASSIYQDFITSTLADSLTRNGGIGIAKSFERQLTHPDQAVAAVASPGNSKPAAALVLPPDKHTAGDTRKFSHK
jgi:peptidoglycan hydrolase FlgJ